jgi:sulfate/thiosulfate transport system ATP-binding protein
MSLKIDSVAKAFGRFPALSGIELDVAEGEFLALLGPSGSGKTTLLRILAGLEKPDAGTVRFDEEDFLAQSARERRVGMVFQHYALFRHMTVAQNVAFGLRVRPRKQRPSRKAINTRVADLLRLVQLEDLGKRYPAQLSGGQRQRVALARALAIEPRLLLLDEPFGALDAKVRRELRRWLRHIHDETGVTTVFVTHDQEEALDLADRVAILKDGELVQVGEPQAVYDDPADAFVFEFLGQAVKLNGECREGRLVVLDWASNAPCEVEGPVDVFFRPHELDLEPESGQGVPATVLWAAPRGGSLHLSCTVAGEELLIELPASKSAPFIVPGAVIRLRPTRFKIFPQT